MSDPGDLLAYAWVEVKGAAWTLEHSVPVRCDMSASSALSCETIPLPPLLLVLRGRQLYFK